MMGSLKTRLTMGILSLGYILASILFIGIALGWFAPIDYFDFFLIDLNNRWILGLVSFFIFMLTFILFLSCFKTKSDKLAAIHQTALGQIDITLSALESLILKAAKKTSGVKEVKPILKLTENKLSVLLKVKVNPDINIPQITAELQHAVKDYLAQTAGTSLQDIKIQVTQINMDSQISQVE